MGEGWRGPIDCPQCGRKKLYVSFVEERCYCFYCAARLGGLRRDLVELADELGFGGLEDFRIYMENSFLHSGSNRKRKISRIQSTLNLLEASRRFGKNRIIEEAVRFCRRKRIPESEWSEIYIDGDDYGDVRLYFPIFFGGEYKGYQARLILGSGPKDLTPGLRSNEVIYNFDRIVGRSSCVLVFESMFDIWLIDPSVSVSVFGHHVGKSQMDTIMSNFDLVVFCFDGDARGDAEGYMQKGRTQWPWKQVFFLDVKPDEELWDIQNDLLNRYVISDTDRIRLDDLLQGTRVEVRS